MPGPGHTTLLFDTFRLPPDTDLLYRGETVVPLEPQAIRVLRHLARNADRVVPKNEVMDLVWPDVRTTEDVLKKAVSQIRRALGDEVGRPRYVATYHRRGYRFVGIVRTAAPPSTRAVMHTAVPDPDYDQLVGRDAELAALQAEFRCGVEESRSMLILGDPGIGKTQLARHFERWATEQGARCLYARFHNYEASRRAPYEVFLDLLRTALAGPTMPARGDQARRLDVRRRALERWGVDLPVKLIAQTPQEPTGPSVASDRYRAIVPLSDCFGRMCAEQPVVLVLDDVQWADESDRDLIADLMRNPHGGPLLFLLLARREEAESQTHPLAQWLRRQSIYRAYSVLTLRPLPEDAVPQIIERAFGTVHGLDLFPGDVRNLHRITGGNPYFLTEMLRLLVAQQVLSRDERARRWSWTGVRELRLPDTLVMAARTTLDRLPPAVRHAVEQASVIGDEFRLRTWAAVAGCSDRELEPMLAEAAQCGVLSERDVSAGEDCRFVHTILRQVLYESLAPRSRRALHQTAAYALESTYADRPEPVAAAIAVHCEAAGELRRDFDWSLRAYRAARARWQWPQALEAAERAQRAADALRGQTPPGITAVETLLLELALGESYASLGRLHDSESVSLAALQLARDLGERRHEAAASLQLATTRIALSAYRDACSDAARAVEMFAACGDETDAAQARVQLASAKVALGRYDEVGELLGPALDARDGDVAAAAAGVLGWARALQSRYEEAVPLLERGLAALRRGGDLRRRALLLRRLHWVELARGRCEQAVELALRAREDYHRAEDVVGVAKSYMGIGQARIAQGRFDEGIANLRRTLDSLEQVGDSHCEGETLWLLGRAHGEAGRPEQGLPLLTRALEIVRGVGDQDDEFRVLTDLARVHLRLGAKSEALRCAELAVAIADDLRSRDGLGVALVEYSRALSACNDRDRAHDAARRAVDLLDSTGSGERWRAYAALADTEPRAQAAEAARERSVALLSELRGLAAAGS